MHNHSEHSHSHGHSLNLDTLGKAFILGIVLNIVFVVIEFLAGFFLNSVALMSDAGHNLSDVISLALAMFAFRLAKSKPTDTYTYGKKKSTILISLLNAFILLVAIGIILYESIEKLRNPIPVEGGLIAWVAGVGILINGFTAWLFLRHKDKDLNVKGAYLHMVADALVSLGVVISGVVISYTGWYIIDPVIGILIVVVIFISTWGLLRDSVRLAMDGVPADIDGAEMKKIMLESDPRIKDIHHIHIWALSTTDNALTAHITVEDLAYSQELKCSLKNLLGHHGISHATLEFETMQDECGHECGELL